MADEDQLSRTRGADGVHRDSDMSASGTRDNSYKDSGSGSLGSNTAEGSGLHSAPTVQGASEFERIKRNSKELGEHWSARDLSRVLGYTDYRNFVRVIRKAEMACQNSGQEVGDHFVDVNDMIEVGKGARRKVADVLMSRYACYLVIQNSDPTKEIVALGQTYFAVQTHRQEQADQLAGLSEEQKRLYLRGQLVTQQATGRNCLWSRGDAI